MKTTNKYDNTHTRLLMQKEVASILGVSAVTFRQWKDCPCVRIGAGGNGHAVRYRLDDVLEYLNNKRSTTPKATTKGGQHEH